MRFVDSKQAESLNALLLSASKGLTFFSKLILHLILQMETVSYRLSECWVSQVPQIVDYLPSL